MGALNRINSDLWISKELLVKANDESIRFKLNRSLNLDGLPPGRFHIMKVYNHEGWKYESGHRSGCIRLLIELPPLTEGAGNVPVALDITGDTYQDILAENQAQ